MLWVVIFSLFHDPQLFQGPFLLISLSLFSFYFPLNTNQRRPKTKPNQTQQNLICSDRFLTWKTSNFTFNKTKQKTFFLFVCLTFLKEKKKMVAANREMVVFCFDTLVSHYNSEDAPPPAFDEGQQYTLSLSLSLSLYIYIIFGFWVFFFFFFLSFIMQLDFVYIKCYDMVAKN